MDYYIGLDIGATKIEGILINKNSKIIKSEKIPTPQNQQQFLNSLFALISRLKIKKISGIGLGVPGQIKNGKIISLHNLPQIKNLNLTPIIKKKFKTTTLIENDANCFALAEAVFRKEENLVGLTLGSGVGGGIIINSRLYRGKDGLAGEFGQIKYLNKTFEDYCSGKFFKRKGWLFQEFGFHLGNLLNVIANSFNPEIIVLGGSVAQSFNRFKKTMQKTFKKSLAYPQLSKTKILPSKLKHAGALGAAYLVIFKNHPSF